mgnify:CR=1 FL=1
MNCLTGKKLLILGANPETAALVTVAKDMGIFTIVTDYDPSAYAKAYADKSYDVDALDIEKLVALVQTDNIDGVLVGVADALIPAYQKVCEQTNKFCYATKEQVNVLTNKDFFKRKCEEYGICGVPEYHIEDQDIAFPVIVKPTDSNSGKGISLCYTNAELPAAIKKAKSFSRSETYLLEKYMECEDVSIYYTIKDGTVYLSSLSDRYTNKEQGKLSPICSGDIFPSGLLDLFLEKEHPKFCNMLQDLGLKNGIFYTSAFYQNNTFYVYDPGFRLQGGGFHLILNAVNGFDHRKMLINYALTGDMGVPEFTSKNDPYLNGKAAAVIWFLLKPGKIALITGLDYLKKHSEVVHIVQRFHEGDIIPESAIGTERQVFLRVFLVCEDKTSLKNIVKDMQEQIKVFDEFHHPMLLKGIDIDKVIKNKEGNEHYDS